MKTTMILSLFLFSLASLAGAAEKTPAQREDCQKAADKAVTKAFLKDSGYTAAEMEKYAEIQKAYDAGTNQITVNVASNDSRDWDGYAEYTLTLKVTATSCSVEKIELTGSEGI